jgi:hypothetical protein
MLETVHRLRHILSLFLCMIGWIVGEPIFLMSRLWDGRPTSRGSIWDRSKRFICSPNTSRMALKYTQPRIQWTRVTNCPRVEWPVCDVPCVWLLPPGGTCVALALPSFPFFSSLTFTFWLPSDFDPEGNPNGCKICVWLLFLNSLPVGTYLVCVHALRLGSELRILLFRFLKTTCDVLFRESSQCHCECYFHGP